MPATKTNANAHGRRKKARLSQLLVRRASLGVQWAEQMSHAGPLVGTVMSELALVETAIVAQWPHMVSTWLPQWAIADTQALHDVDLGQDVECSLCVSAAETSQQAA